jgi:hypothetical protein
MQVRNTLVVLMMAAAATASAQLLQTARFEIPLPEDDQEGYEAMSLRSNGVILYKSYFGKDSDMLEIIRLDSSLQKIWGGFITLDKGLMPFAAGLESRQAFFILRQLANPYSHFRLLVLDTDTGTYFIRTIRNTIPFHPKLFVPVKGAVLIGGYFNYRPLVLHYGISSDQARVLPGFFNETGEITQIKETEDGAIEIILSARFYDKRRSLWIRTYSPAGDLLKTVILQADPDKHLIFGRSLQLPDGAQLVGGVYGINTEYSRGVFVAKVDSLGDYVIRYYNFAELHNFFKFMKAQREERIKKRIERRKIKGRKIRLAYRILVNDLLATGNDYVLLCEAFYPRYKYPARETAFLTVAGFYGAGNMIFDGYHYTHAVVIGFSQDGKITWDNSFEINDVRSFDLEQFVVAIPDQNELALFYLFDNDIRQKTITGLRMLEGKTKIPLRPMLRTDQVVAGSTTETRLQTGPGSALFATGIQVVKNPSDLSVPPHRKVFFVNKLVYR